MSGIIFTIVLYLFLHVTIFTAKDPNNSPLYKFWRRQNYIDNIMIRKADPQILHQIDDLQKKYKIIHSLKNNLLQQKEILKERLDKLEGQKFK